MPTLSKSHRDQELNSGWFDNRAKGILVVKTISLFESFYNKPCLVSLNRAIRLLFNFECPLAVYNIYFRMRGNKPPCFVLL
jgi:hypothetical protein